MWFFFVLCSGTNTFGQILPGEYWKMLDSAKYFNARNEFSIGNTYTAKMQKLARETVGEDNEWYIATYSLMVESSFNSGDTVQAYLHQQEHNRRISQLIERKGRNMLSLERYSQGLQNLAHILMSMKRVKEAESACKACIQINKPDGSEQFYGSWLNYLACRRALADIYCQTGRESIGIVQYEEIVRFSEDLLRRNQVLYVKGLTNEICFTLVSLSRTHIRSGNYHFAELTLREARRYGEMSLPDPFGHEGYIGALDNLATTLASLGQYNEARKFFLEKDSIFVRKQVSNDVRGLHLSNMASSLKNLTSEERIKLWQEALPLFNPTSYANALTINTNLAEAFAHAGRPDEADRAVAAAESALHKLPDAAQREIQIMRIAHLPVLARGSLPEALRILEKTIKRYPTYEYHYLRLWRDKARILTRMGRVREAKAAWEQTLRIRNTRMETVFPYLSELQREEYLNQYDEIGEQYLSAMFLLNKKVKSLDTGFIYDLLLQSKGNMLDAVRRSRLELHLSGDSTLLKKQASLKAIRQTIAAQETSAFVQSRAYSDSLAAESERLEKELSRLSPGLPHVNHNWKQIQAGLKPDEAAVEMVRFRIWNFSPGQKDLFGSWRDSVCYAALILRSGRAAPRVVLFPDGRALEGTSLRAYREDLARQTYDADTYRLFWAPMGPALSGVSTVYLSADGVYYTINPGTLLNRHSGRFLAEEMNIHVVNSTRMLVTPATESSGSRSIALFGFPDYLHAADILATDTSRAVVYQDRPRELARGGSLDPLPGTRIEIAVIDTIARAKGWGTRLYSGSEASETQLKQLRNPEILHIATHGYFLADTVRTSLSKQALLRTGLALAGASDSTNFLRTQQDDGLLVAYEAADLALEGTQHVTLSACETGLGSVRNGNGVFGLQRAFLAAGAKSVLMSLWRVNDHITTKLMEQFYRHWLADGLDKAKALALAQKEVRESSDLFSHPYYWGGFVLITR